MAKEKNKTELPQVVEGELKARLIKLREDAGFNVSQMANALCLSEDVIINLEAESFDLLPEPPYVRGYLRNYAKLSNTNNDDAKELISRYESLRGADASELDFQAKSAITISDASNKSMTPIFGQVLLLGLLVGALALIYSIPAVNNWLSEKWSSFSSQLEPSDASNNPSLLGDLPVPTPLPEAEVATTTENSSTAKSEATTQNNSATTENQSSTATSTATTPTTSTENTDNTTTTSTETAAESTDTTSESTANATPETTTETVAETSTEQEIPAASADGSINIKLGFNNEVWLRIKDKDNKTVFEGLNKADTEKTVDLVKPLTFRVGNAQGLSLFVDGKAVDISSYINGSIANFTLE